MKKLTILLIVLSLLMVGCQERNPDWLTAKDYLEKHSKPITLTQEIVDFELPTEVLRNNEIYLTGEIHGYERNEALRFAFLKYFKEQTHFKYYLNEISYSGAYFLNQYLKTGDEAILEQLYAYYEGTFEWNQDNYNHWKKVYAYNQTLPEEEKIQVVGIDLEHQYPLAFDFLKEMIAQYNVSHNSDFDTLITLVTTYDEMSTKEIYDQTKKLLTIIESNETLWKTTFGDDYFGIKMVIDNIIYKYQASTYDDINDFNRYRDAQMYQNFEVIDQKINNKTHFSNEKYFGQWGYIHTFQESLDDITYLAGYMNDYNKYEGQVLSISYIYENSTQMTKDNGSYESKNYDYTKDRFENITEAITGETLFLDINQYDSVFDNKLIWPYKSLEPNENTTLDYVDYFVLIRDSGPTQPLSSKK